MDDKFKDIPITDAHMHLDEKGRYIEAAREFKAAGGTAIILVNKPVWTIPTFEELYETTLRIAEKVREEVELKVGVVLGPHPAYITRLTENGRMPLDEAVVMMAKAIRLAGDKVEEGEAVAIGEIGRPHYPVSKEVMAASNEIMRTGFEVAADAQCAVVLHTESTTIGTFKELAELADDVGIPRERVVKHFCPPFVKQEENLGIFPSVLANERFTAAAVKAGKGRFLLETDYLDDPNRPGAVLGPKTVPKRTLELLRSGGLSVEDVHRIHKENVDRIFHLDEV